MANVVGCLPISVQVGARKALAEICDAPDREHAEQAIEVFARDYGTKWPKAVAKITDDAEALLCFFDLPAEHGCPSRPTTGSSPPSRRSSCGPG